jgi:hypothetical protein
MPVVYRSFPGTAASGMLQRAPLSLCQIDRVLGQLKRQQPIRETRTRQDECDRHFASSPSRNRATSLASHNCSTDNRLPLLDRFSATEFCHVRLSP